MWVLWLLGAILLATAVYDLLQRRHAILRNFPIVGHFRYLLESVGPELRQYIVTDNDEERPFSRDQRRWIYASSKHENNYFGFGTDNNIEAAQDYLIIKHSTFPVPSGHDPDGYPIPVAKVVGAHRGRKKAFRPASVVNISGMSFGSLSPPAVEALNQGARIAGCLQSTGEGGVSPYHKQGGDLIWQIGTGYFGCREAEGRFSVARMKDVIAATPTIRAIELKLSQGAKPGLGGVLPAAKVSHEISMIRGVPMGKDCVSPNHHSAFRDVDSMLDFAAMIAEETGLPVGIKSAVGQLDFWHELARTMADGKRGVDFITIDGGEGGTGAAPLVFTDHVSLPFKVAFTRVYRVFAEMGVHEQVCFAGSGKLGFPEAAVLAITLGCEWVNVAREAMLAIGCIQAQRCHTDHCPTGVATQNRWLMRGLDPTLKSARCANYL
ncbi:MAG: Ferredoxin-dependent glutamate synthase 2, partial [Acidobacteriota bacterium]